MKRFMIFVLVLAAAFLTACNASGDQAASGETVSLLVSGGETSQTYTRADLEALGASQATFNDVTYVGVSVGALLEDAGFNLDEVKAVKAVASDGYTVNYDPAQVLAADVIVAYARADGDLVDDEGPFRMVLPGTEGKLNARMLVELQVVK
ncbi:MAG TPA: molybdopterin-dependent oxidoreductase [Anaerolineales bacterium]|nr:molybdopterin-dependent oxidoreductase [Anaerolineales bacterium]